MKLFGSILISIVFFCNIIAQKPEGSIKYLNVEYDVYKYVPNRKTLDGFRGYLDTGNRVTVVCIAPNNQGVLDLTLLENSPMYKRVLGYYNVLKNNNRCYVFLDELAD